MRRVLLAFMLACSAPEEAREPQQLLGARLVCSDVSQTCKGEVHATYYATPESSERVVASVLESFADAKIDETNQDPTVTVIAWHDATLLVYAPESGTDWFHASCALRDGERTIIDVGYVSR